MSPGAPACFAILCPSAQNGPVCPAVVAECLGSLALLNGELVLPALRSHLASPSGAWRWWLMLA